MKKIIETCWLDFSKQVNGGNITAVNEGLVHVFAGVDSFADCLLQVSTDPGKLPVYYWEIRKVADNEAYQAARFTCLPEDEEGNEYESDGTYDDTALDGAKQGTLYSETAPIDSHDANTLAMLLSNPPIQREYEAHNRRTGEIYQLKISQEFVTTTYRWEVQTVSEATRHDFQVAQNIRSLVDSNLDERRIKGYLWRKFKMGKNEAGNERKRHAEKLRQNLKQLKKERAERDRDGDLKLP